MCSNNESKDKFGEDERRGNDNGDRGDVDERSKRRQDERRCPNTRVEKMNMRGDKIIVQ
jgi:hypothetical protein